MAPLMTKVTSLRHAIFMKKGTADRRLTHMMSYLEITVQFGSGAVISV